MAYQHSQRAPAHFRFRRLRVSVGVAGPDGLGHRRGVAGRLHERPAATHPGPGGTAPGTTAPSASAAGRLQPASWAEIGGWSQDDVRAAWPALLASCQALKKRADWNRVCAVGLMVDAGDLVAMRAYFETNFLPYRVVNVDGTDNGLITGTTNRSCTAPARVRVRTRSALSPAAATRQGHVAAARRTAAEPGDAWQRTGLGG
jgi:membrane-bound lytic murein transglycosylase A